MRHIFQIIRSEKFDIGKKFVFSPQQTLKEYSTVQKMRASIIHYFNHSHPYIMLDYAEETNRSHTDRKFYVQKNGCLNLKSGDLFRK